MFLKHVPTNDLVEVIDQLRAMAAKLNLKISEDDFGEEE